MRCLYILLKMQGSNSSSTSPPPLPLFPCCFPRSGAEWEAEQLGHSLMVIWDPSACRGRISQLSHHLGFSAPFLNQHREKTDTASRHIMIQLFGPATCVRVLDGIPTFWFDLIQPCLLMGIEVNHWKENVDVSLYLSNKNKEITNLKKTI